MRATPKKLVAVLATTMDARCTDGTAVRVDRHRDFIQRWLSEQEGIPACAAAKQITPRACPIRIDVRGWATCE